MEASATVTPAPAPRRASVIMLWVISVLGAAALMVYQRRTGPTYPISGAYTLGQTTTRYSLIRTHSITSAAEIHVAAPNPETTGSIIYRRYPSDDPFGPPTPLVRMGGDLCASIGPLPPAGKFEYYVELHGDGQTVRLPEAPRSAIIRFKGDVSAPVLILHIAAMVLAGILGIRAGVAALLGHPHRSLTSMAAGVLCAGGLVLGPMVQKAAFGAYWTGWPLGEDLTDTKTLVALIPYAIGWALLRRERTASRARWFVAAGTFVLLATYIVPHSTRGSQIDYRKAGGATAAPSAPGAPYDPLR